MTVAQQWRLPGSSVDAATVAELAALDGRVTALDGRAVALGGRVTVVDGRVTTLAEGAGALGGRIDGVDERVTTLENADPPSPLPAAARFYLVGGRATYMTFQDALVMDIDGWDQDVHGRSIPEGTHLQLTPHADGIPEVGSARLQVRSGGETVDGQLPVIDMTGAAVPWSDLRAGGLHIAVRISSAWYLLH